MTTLNVECLEVRVCPSTLTYHGGPVLSHLALTTIYIGDPAPWNGFDALGLVAAGDYAGTAAPYDVYNGYYLGSINLADPGPLTDAQVRMLLAREIATGALPPPGPNSCYMVCLPENVTDPQWQLASAYHQFFQLPDGRTVVYGVTYAQPNAAIPFTHEVIEMATDPQANGWFTSDGFECADLFAWVPAMLDSLTVSQYALPDGSPAIPPATPTTPTPPTPSTTSSLFVLAIERVQADFFSLVSRFDAALVPQAQAAQQAVTSNPWHGTAPGTQVEQQADAVFISWLGQP